MSERIATSDSRAPYGWRPIDPPHDDMKRTAGASPCLKPGTPFLIPLLSRKQRAVFAMLCGCWAVTLIAFWMWWLRPEHDTDTFRYAANCVVLFWTTVIPGYFMLIFARARVSNPAWPVPDGLRVAMVVTKAPSEPFAVVQTTLLAMLRQSYPHDTWLADEDPDVQTIEWCMRHGVLLSTRKDVTEYHNRSWPRRTRCKEGNLAYFYDHYGYERYDLVAQLDADHVPEPGYLEAILRPFADPRVGYVSAPSICDSNAATSWSARGRLHAEGALHGSLQAGHNGGLAPLCIGSHYAVRTVALRSIGGLGPELAEDHSTTLMMNAHGWRGVHALDAIAHGEGPRTFADMATQEYQWSKSLAVILLRYTRRYFGQLPLRLKAQFLFAQFWYPLFSLAMAATVAMPVVALLTHRVWANVAYLPYFAHASAVTASILLVMAWVKRTGSFRPFNAKVASWEGIAFLFARWPWSLLGIGSAIADCVRGREFAFRVTPKGTSIDARPPLRVVLPYLLISLGCSVPLVAIDNPGNARGFYVISAFNALVYLGIALLIVVAHAYERGQRVSLLRLLAGDGPAVRRVAFAASALLLGVGMSIRLPEGANALLGRDVAAQSVEVKAAVQPPLLGVYDPDHAFAADKGAIDIEHIFVSWDDPGAATLIQNAHEYASQLNRQLMVSVEAWPARSRDSHTLLRDIRMGGYDAEIDAVCSSLRSLNGPVFVRWAQEMETPTGRYPWAANDPSGYVEAYRHFVDRCRGGTQLMRFVWSPRGDAALASYFPGEGYADYVGLSVFDCSSCGSARAGGDQSVARMLQEKYLRVTRYGLPVIVAEMGVDGGAERQRTELIELQHVMRTMPMLKAVLYFNSVDSPGAWPMMLHQPDWRVAPGVLNLIGSSDRDGARRPGVTSANNRRALQAVTSRR
jgi:cellulose synthase (UDP-forming)